jgi:imidazolonepropionase-like amidohydrolase
MGIDGVEHPAWWSASGGGLFDRVKWLETLDHAEVAATAEALAKHHVVVDATLIAIHTKFFGNSPRYLENPDNALAPPLVERGWAPGSFTRDWTAAQYDEAQRAWPKLLALQKTLFDAGVVMTVGTDMPTPWIVPGASMHDEMLLLRDAGIPPMDVLRMATSNAALALHRDSGAIAAGKRADLVLLTANPLDDLRNTRKIELVVKGGVAYDPRGLLADATARSH